MDTGLGLAGLIRDNTKFYEYLIQVALVYTIVVVSLVNLSLKIGDSELWKFLLLTFIGFFLPSPSLRKASTPNFALNDLGSLPSNISGDGPDPSSVGTPIAAAALSGALGRS